MTYACFMKNVFDCMGLKEVLNFPYFCITYVIIRARAYVRHFKGQVCHMLHLLYNLGS